MCAPIKTLLVDDQVLFREAMHTLLALDNGVEIVA
jgi:DNA-binding NarL/FixJ family response regulator